MAVDLSAQTPPPAANRPKPSRKTATRTPKKTSAETREQRTEGVAGLFQLAGGLCVATGNIADGVTIGKYGPEAAKEFALLAERDERLARVVDFLSNAGPYAGLISVMVSMGLQLAVNHDRIPIEAVRPMGILPPDELIQESVAEAAEAYAAQAERTAEAAQRQRDAEQRVVDLQKSEGNPE